MAKDGRYHFDDGRGPDDPSAVCMSVTAYTGFDTLHKEHPETWEAAYGDKTLWRFIPPVGVSSPYFSSDRAAKYGWGLPRLALVCLIAFELAPRVSSAVSSPSQAAALGLLPYLRSCRWIGHLYIGSIGAAVNVQIRSVAFNLCMLGGAAALILYDMRFDYAILIYMLKTFSGDFIAGKLDTLEWRLVLIFTGIVALAAWHLEAANAPLAFQPYTRILPALATVQLICELGDAHLEHWSFFRHRYSFEILSLLVLFGLHLTPEEFLPIQHDLVICLGYRASNLAIIFARAGDYLAEAAMAVAAGATAASFILRTQAAPPIALLESEEETASSSYLVGLGFSGLALVGSTAVGALRKVVSAKGVGSAEQVGVACLVQGVVALAFCLWAGEIGTAPLPARFWYAATGASLLLVLVKTLETRAYAVSDISLCAPFLAFDPVMQLLVGVLAMPVLCPLIGLGCDEPKQPYPLYHLLALVCVVIGAFSLSQGAQVGSARGSKAKRVVGGLAVGSWYILFNCVIYGFTSRMDKVAIASSSKTVYYAWGRLIMAGTALAGSAAASGGGARSLSRRHVLLQPSVMILILLTCGADALYQLSQYQAMAKISPVYVTAVKRGGGILLSSVVGAVLFAESLQGRLAPILSIVVGVVFLCL